MKKIAVALLLIIAGLALAGQVAPEHIAVQHILIAFQGSIPEAKVTRTQAEAEALAKDIFARAQKGEDFDALVKQYTDDQYPGIYRMSNFNAAPDASKQEYPRAKMVKSFGDVGFSLDRKSVV
jgi:type II secretory pathway component PulL